MRDRVVELLDYDPLRGEFRWRVSRGSIRGGQLAGTISHDYRQIRIDGRLHYAHRLVWLVTYGEWPPEQIDHINGVRDDNRLVNLRLATHTENMRNRAHHRNNISGHPGVHFAAREQKYLAKLTIARRTIHLGYYSTVEEAVQARQVAEIEHFGSFRRFA